MIVIVVVGVVAIVVVVVVAVVVVVVVVVFVVVSVVVFQVHVSEKMFITLFKRTLVIKSYLMICSFSGMVLLYESTWYGIQVGAVS